MPFSDPPEPAGPLSNEQERDVIHRLAEARARHRRRANGVLAGLALAMLLVVAFVFLAGYYGRAAQRDNAVAGCQRSTADRTASAWGWRTAQAAREREGGAANLRTARGYAALARGLEARAGLSGPVNPERELDAVLGATEEVRAAFCQRAFPQTPLLPWSR